MDSNLKLLVYVIIGLLLLWFTSSFYFKVFKKKKPDDEEMPWEPEPAPPEDKPVSGAKPPPKQYKETSSSGGLMTCPVCSSKLDNSDMVKTQAFPPLTPDDNNRLMHIFGCYYCMDGRRDRWCPVCGKALSLKDFLIARMFERSLRRSHVHVLGCTLCRPLKTM